jgi:prepilin-type N-terminal cleavage/methylation domain-containing protein
MDKTNKFENHNSREEGGFTFIELLSVIVILGILLTIAVISIEGIIEGSEKDVCHVNRTQLEKWYHDHLVLKGEEHTEVAFVNFRQQFGSEICPVNGDVHYIDGKVYCNVHPAGDHDENEDHEDDGGSIPFL